MCIRDSGYIVGFVFTAIIVGLVADKFGKKFRVSVLSMTLGVAVCYAFGTAWFYILYNNVNAQPMSCLLYTSRFFENSKIN